MTMPKEAVQRIFVFSATCTFQQLIRCIDNGMGKFLEVRIVSERDVVESAK